MMKIALGIMSLLAGAEWVWWWLNQSSIRIESGFIMINITAIPCLVLVVAGAVLLINGLYELP